MKGSSIFQLDEEEKHIPVRWRGAAYSCSQLENYFFFPPFSYFLL